MKKSSSIITHIKNHSFYSKIKNIECFNKLKSLLPPRLSNAILFIYIKNKTLFFVLNHPGFKMEFYYNVNLIKRLLKELKKVDLFCKEIEIENIKVFVSNKAVQNDEEEKIKSNITYNEKAIGNFDIKTDNEKLKNIFKNIQTIIKNHSS